MELTRERLIRRLSEDVIGPKYGPHEVIDERPTGRYLTGILFPQQTEFSEEEDETVSAENTTGSDGSEDAAEEVALFRSFKPSTCGFSFAVEGGAPELQLVIEYARYRAEEIAPEAEPADLVGSDDGSQTGKDDAGGSRRRVRVKWRREAVHREITLPLKEGSGSVSVDTGLRMHRRVRFAEGLWSVTLQFVNEYREVLGGKGEPSELFVTDFIGREEGAFLQFRATARCSSGEFAPRPQLIRGGDEDQEIADLIYRDVREFAVGHTCSAEWTSEDDGSPTEISTAWMPASVVKRMDAAGDPILAESVKKSPIGSLQALRLAEAETADLLATLRALPAGYDAWLTARAAEITQLPEALRPTAKSNLDRCRLARDRMLEGIALLEADGNALTAFRLANRAMYIQAGWAGGYREAHTHTGAAAAAGFTWFPFQLAFTLVCLASASDRRHKDRRVFDLIWFPTGGGKTEAYLLLAAYVLFLRRLTGKAAGQGVGVLMRYTLRTLTVQQFQRAAALICACDLLRRGNSAEIPGDEFAIGLWVGGDSTPNAYAEAKSALNEIDPKSSPRQLTDCPACKEVLEWRDFPSDSAVGCVCETEGCALGASLGRLPVRTVDEELYARPPSLLIGTVDKFAQIVRNKRTPALFGRGGGFKPPDLIIQDELHLIGGPLGSMTGLYEAAVDELCSTPEGPPKIVGSTATIRRAEEQIRLVFHRSSFQFPPPAFDASNSCFAKIDEKDRGRRYVGLTTAGRSEKFALQTVAASLVQGVADPALGSDEERDPYWTLVTYFNSLKVLGGALVLMEDDVRVTVDALAKQREETARKIETPEELTSRKKSSEIPEILKRLGKPMTDADCVDVLLASNMLSVGVDIPRLGLMLVNGQPKFMAEYIQATSRVGRRAPGLVVTLYNNNKIRDRAHFEAFCSWHSAIYRSVEPSSVTPYAPRARDKALHAPLVALVRHLVSPTSPIIPADRRKDVDALVDRLVARISQVDGGEAAPARDELEQFLEAWRTRAVNGQLKHYWNDIAFSASLLMSAEAAAARRAVGRREAAAVPTPNSVRNVEPSVQFVLKESAE